MASKFTARIGWRILALPDLKKTASVIIC
jgi:hypothetical protein